MHGSLEPASDVHFELPRCMCRFPEELEKETDYLADPKGSLRGDGLEEDGWLIPEDEDQGAQNATTAATASGRGRVIMLPIIVGPLYDVVNGKGVKANGEAVSDEDMKELMKWRARPLVGKQRIQHVSFVYWCSCSN